MRRKWFLWRYRRYSHCEQCWRAFQKANPDVTKPVRRHMAPCPYRLQTTRASYYCCPFCPALPYPVRPMQGRLGL